MIGAKHSTPALSYALRHGLSGGSEKALRNFRDGRVREIIAHAYENVPYYRELMQKNGILPRDIRGIKDLVHFPISRKNDFQGQSPEPFIDRRVEPRKLIRHKTSGSTGQPLSIYRSWFEERVYGACRWSIMREYGYRPGDRHAELEELQPQENGDSRFLHRSLQAAGLFRQRRIQALQEPEAICGEINRWQPDVLSGYTGVVSRTAAAMPEAVSEQLNTRFVACHSDRLTQGMRRQISGTFRAPVYEIYDAYEINVIAWQCPQQDLLHAADSCAVVDLVRDGRPAAAGESGEVVLTALHSFSMPFIRYAIGDLATRAKACPCGRASSTLKSVDGRTVEYFPLVDGRVVHPYEVYAVLGDTNWIRQYQLVQECLQSFRLDVVATEQVSVDFLEQHRGRVARFLGEGTNFQINVVERLGSDQDRKLRAFRSLVSSA